MKIYQESESSFSLLLLLQQANKQRKGKNKKMLAEEAGKSRYLVQLCTVVDFQVGKEEFGWHKNQVLQGLAKSIHTKIGVCVFVCLHDHCDQALTCPKPWGPLPNFLVLPESPL
jgi:hypothetical protein